MVNLPPKQKLDRVDALRVLSLMRRKKYSFTNACKKEGISRYKARKYISRGIKKQGRFLKPKLWDAIPRTMNFWWRGKTIQITVRDSRYASWIGEYNSAVRVFLETGNKRVLEKFRGKKVRDVQGKKYEFITNPEKILEMAERREDEEFYSLYVSD